MRFVKGGSSLRTRRGSMGVRSENCGFEKVVMCQREWGHGSAASRKRSWSAYELGHLYEHPVVGAVSEEIKELWCKSKKTLQGVFPASRKLEHDIDCC